MPSNEPQVATPPAAPQPGNTAPTATVASMSQSTFEMAIFGVAVITIASFLFSNGLLLKVGLIVMLALAIVAISRNMRGVQKGEIQPVVVAAPAAKKPVNWYKVIGISVLLILLAPVLYYGAMIAFFIILISIAGASGGSAGT